MATSKTTRRAVLNFTSATSKTHMKHITVEWSKKKVKICRLCVSMCTVTTGEVVLMFVTLNPGETTVDLPLQLDTEAGTVRLVVYGLAERDSGQSQYYTIAGSCTKRLTNAIAETLEGNVIVQLSPRHTEDATCIKLQEKVEEFQIGIKQQPPSWYYVSNLPTTGGKQKAAVHQYLIVIQQREPFEESLILRSTSSPRVLIPSALPSLTDFSTKVYWMKSVLQTDQYTLYTVFRRSDTIDFRTYLSLEEMSTLLKRATSLVPRNKKNDCHFAIPYFYRNKPPEYYANIFKNRGGVMETYRKDYNGDRGSPINGNIDGLFFGTGLDPKTLLPPAFSYYGRQRLHIPAHVIFHDATNLYFADFYCHYEVHYVTLVLTLPGSPADVFCQNRLLKLDPYNNPFLYKNTKLLPLSPSQIYVTNKLHVEVFYTEHVNIGAMIKAMPRDVFFRDVQPMGAGKSKPSGIPKNANCKICNLK
ncbi:phytanoyl-CoA hydroxylase-interacting protein-like [Haliotis asinina]|uniref:phytanoyl-CoA hydroxylase-interacting protein-like n=1 Tax=Haliotis asinina TaxID=109174 RepID=UPI00353197F9